MERRLPASISAIARRVSPSGKWKVESVKLKADSILRPIRNIRDGIGLIK